jgi:uncharacterized protein YjbJ (UPF0337 family)
MKDAVKGKVEEVKGKITGNKGEEMKGKARQATDRIQRVGRDIREDLREEATDRQERERARRPSS